MVETFSEIGDGGVIHKGKIRKLILPEHINVKPQTDYFLQTYVWLKCVKSGLIKNNNIFFDEYRRSWEDNAFFVKVLDKTEQLVCIADNLYRTAGSEDSADHLSGKIDENLLWGYIATYSEYRDKFGKEFNFNNDYTYKRYLNNVLNILWSIKQNEDADNFHRILKTVLQKPEVKT